MNCGKPIQESLNEVEEELILDPQIEEDIEDIEEENNSSYIKMDYSIEAPEDRVKKVQEIIANTPSERLTSKYLEKLADYIVFAVEKQERKERKQKQIIAKSEILTDNRKQRINVRETSFEGLVGKLENGEDGIYNMIANDKNIIFQPKVTITEKDLEEIPDLKQLHNEILRLEEIAKTARGKRAYNLKKQIIEMRQDQYIIKNSFRKPIYSHNILKNFSSMNFDENITIDIEGHVQSDCFVNFYNEKHVSALLCNYSKLKEDTWDRLNSDGKWLIADFENLIDATLKEKYPMYYDLLIYKIDGKQNIEIQEILFKDYGIKHSVEYLSSLWRNKIPKLIVQQAENDYLMWYYTFKEKGKWKRCSRCGQIKLAHNNFFSKNKTSKDGFYSICKECRNKK